MYKRQGQRVLVAPGAEDALARAISDLLADEAERARMAQGGGALFEQRYTLERVAGRMVDLIESVASVGHE